MLDVYIPEGALRPEAERALLTRLTDILTRVTGDAEEGRNIAEKRIAASRAERVRIPD